MSERSLWKQIQALTVQFLKFITQRVEQCLYKLKKLKKPLTTKAVDNKEEYEVKDIVKESTDRKKNEKIYLVKWKGYSDSKNSWVSEKDLTNTFIILVEWKRKVKASEVAQIDKKKQVVQKSGKTKK